MQLTDRYVEERTWERKADQIRNKVHNATDRAMEWGTFYGLIIPVEIGSIMGMNFRYTVNEGIIILASTLGAFVGGPILAHLNSRKTLEKEVDKVRGSYHTLNKDIENWASSQRSNLI